LQHSNNCRSNNAAKHEHCIVPRLVIGHTEAVVPHRAFSSRLSPLGELVPTAMCDYDTYSGIHQLTNISGKPTRRNISRPTDLDDDKLT
tara:strand:- start:289 stop:555 length:267 start_codon:yes stop_codon:yes gene_type:complete